MKKFVMKWAGMAGLLARMLLMVTLPSFVLVLVSGTSSVCDTYLIVPFEKVVIFTFDSLFGGTYFYGRRKIADCKADLVCE